MAILLTNGEFFIAHNKTGAVIKVHSISQAQNFYSWERAVQQKNKTPRKCKSYYVIDTDIVERQPETEQPEQMIIPVKKVKRKCYSPNQRKIIYEKSNGICQLCGRKIAFEDMSIDHIIPLDGGGTNGIENTQAACVACNRFKANILPEQFFDRITEIFMYQMAKRYNERKDWKQARNLLMEIL